MTKKKYENKDYSKYIIPKTFESTTTPYISELQNIVERINENFSKDSYLVTKEFLAQEIIHQRVPNFTFFRQKTKDDFLYTGINQETKQRIQVFNVEPFYTLGNLEKVIARTYGNKNKV